MFTLGTDPELVLVNTTDEVVLNALDYLPKAAKFGVDGHRYIAELRPEPAATPKDLVINIRRTLALGGKKIQNLTWLSGAYKYRKPLGGHIHFGDISSSDKILDALDHYLAILLAVTEDPEEAGKRRTTIFYGSNPYGLLGDLRRKPWGFEYRTPSSFLISPAMARGILVAAKAIVLEEAENGKQAYSQISSTLRRRFSFSPKEFYMLTRPEIFQEKVDDLFKVLFNMKYFKSEEGKEHKKYLAYLLEHTIKKGVVSGLDVKKSWNLYDAFLIQEEKKLKLLKSKKVIIKTTPNQQHQEAIFTAGTHVYNTINWNATVAPGERIELRTTNPVPATNPVTATNVVDWNQLIVRLAEE